MKPIVTQLIISTLKGESGSNPTILTCFPNDSGINKRKIIEFTLPTGARSGELFEYTFKGRDLIVYVSEFHQESSRNDIITLSLLLNESAEKDSIISVLRAILTKFNMESVNSMDELTKISIELFKGLNRGKFDYGSYSFDVFEFLSTAGLSLEKEVRTVRGGLF